ncbi:hypothetical protein Ais01nite_17720 [Asanoa ishikariensis]|uniref:Predicted ATPase n=1 Tax=Asanoa ishikariensis TaxID=137265 RepID=A0A1H3UEE1_9ACTN|nr:DUF4062 domain-containing protein [Asanoa ishikariensis]GIF63737.1 hypothetical protein Ais01nite_17720 [Asanoa ishikariensis]SDZ60748.1 Predicted ATPase [Asanoa ishikariensis]
MAGWGDSVIQTPDHRLRIFISSALEELEPERLAVRDTIARMRLVPVMFELGARPAGGSEIYREYIDASQLFIGIYWERYDHAGIENEYLAADQLPRLIYVKTPAPGRDARLAALLDRIRDDARVSYRQFRDADELRRAVGEDIALLLSERFNPAGTEPSTDARVPLPLPVAPNRLLGRAAEQQALSDLLTDPQVRLVTLTGPGGVGKTRLALALGSSLREKFPDGVAFADLSTVVDPDAVGMTIGNALDLRTMPNQSAIENAVAYLRDRSVLLIVDNMEHVTPAATDLSTMLDACPRVTILVTSRVPLRLTGEHVFDVPPLRIPEATDDPTVAVDRDGAAQLFVERARAVNAGFRYDADGAAAIVEIVRRLDGLPLAIELAAAKVRVLPPRALVDRLTRQLGTLTGGARDLPARQRTLRDTIDWSYQLLPRAEQEMFARFGVFSGGFDLDAARAVAEMKDRYAGLESLTELIESSLVTQDNRGPEPRLSMLGVVREFALDKLRSDFDWEDTQERHARYYLAFAEATAPPVGQTSTDPASVDLLEHEHDNLRTAINWLIDKEHMVEAVRLGWMLWPLWWLRGHIDEGARTVRRMLEHEDAAPRRTYAHMLFGDGAISFLSGDKDRARVQLERVLPILREVGDQDVNARAAGMLGQLALTRGDYDEARVLLGETKEISERIGELWMAALYHTRLGLVPFNEGDYAAAAEQFNDGLRTARKTDDHLGEVVALYSLAVTATAADDLETAAQHLAVGLRLSAAASDEAGTALYLSALSDLATRKGDLARAARLASSARKLRAFAGTAWMQAYVLPWPHLGADLDAIDYAEARDQGYTDSLQSAVAYALSDIEP